MRRAWIGFFCLALLLLAVQPAFAAKNYLDCPSSATVTVGKSKKLAIKSDADYIEMYCKDPDIATIDNGTLTGLKVGKTDIVLRANYNSGADTITKTIPVTVKKKSDGKKEKADEKPKPIETFEISAGVRNALRSDAPSQGFAATNLVIRDPNGARLGTLTERTVAAYRGDAENGRVMITAPDGTEGSVVAAGFVAFDGYSAIATVRGTAANMRYGSGMEYGVCQVLAGGNDVPVLARDGNWALVEADGRIGFVAGDLIETVVNIPPREGQEREIALTSMRINLKVGEKKEIAYTVGSQAPAGERPIGDWFSVNSKIAAVEGDTVTGVGAGSTCVCATGKSSQKMYNVQIVVTEDRAAEDGTVPETERQTAAGAGTGEDPQVKTGRTTARRLNVRTGPGPAYHKAYEIDRGTVIYYEEAKEDPEWYKIVRCDARPDFVNHYVLGKYVAPADD